MQLKRIPRSARPVPILMLLALVAAGCAGKSVAPAAHPQDQGRWESKLRIHDVEKDKNQSVSVDVIVDGGESMRLEAAAIMGIPVASYVMDATAFKCALYRAKTFYDGPLGEGALRPLLHFALSPAILRDVVLDRPPAGADWICRNGADRLVADCASASKQIKISWSRREGGRNARIETPKFQIDWVFQEPPTEVQITAKTFQLDPPAGFKVIHLEK